jgi:hypothetical protein
MARTRSHMATRSNKIKKYYHSLPSSTGRTRRRNVANNANRATRCQKKYIIYKPLRADCTPVLRQVLGEGRGKYIQHNGERKMLASIRGKYRFTDNKL